MPPISGVFVVFVQLSEVFPDQRPHSTFSPIKLALISGFVCNELIIFALAACVLWMVVLTHKNVLVPWLLVLVSLAPWAWGPWSWQKDSPACRLPSGLWFLARANKRKLASVQVFKCLRLSKNWFVFHLACTIRRGKEQNARISYPVREIEYLTFRIYLMKIIHVIHQLKYG